MKTIKNNLDLLAQLSLIVIGMAGIAASISNLSVKADVTEASQPAKVEQVVVNDDQPNWVSVTIR